MLARCHPIWLCVFCGFLGVFCGFPILSVGVAWAAACAFCRWIAAVAQQPLVTLPGFHFPTKVGIGKLRRDFHNNADSCLRGDG